MPSLTQMAEPECKTNIRAQRSFASVAHELGLWRELMTSAAGLDGEVRGVKVALRECSRLIGVAQPLAGACGCGPSRAREPVQAALVAVRDRAAGVGGLGLPIYIVASAANVWRRPRRCGRRAAHKGCEHTTRHNRVVAAWVRAVQAPRGAAHTRATAEAPAWTRPTVPCV